jgi:hypothetical protein
MKKIILICLFLSTLFSAEAQLFNVGIKGGLNYNTNGDLIGTVIGIPEADYFTRTSNGDFGYHFGVFADLKLPFWLYLRPELVYTHTESYYQGFPDNNAKLSINKMDIPVLLGFRIIKIVRVFIGPSFQYLMNVKFDDVKATDYDDFTVGMQLGAGLEFGRIGFDVRWEQGFSSTEASFINSVLPEHYADINIDTRPSQIIFGVYWKFFKKRK